MKQLWFSVFSCLLLFELCLGSTAFAQHVTVDVEPKQAAADEMFLLKVSVSGGSLGPVHFKPSDVFEIESRGTSLKQSIINGTVSSSTTYSYVLFPKGDIQPGVYEIPTGYFEQNGNRIYLKRPKVTITKNSGGGEKDKVRFRQTVDKDKPFVGEQVRYTVELTTALSMSSIELSDEQFESFWFESLGDVQESTTAIGTKPARRYVMEKALFPTQAGSLVLPSRSLKADVQVALPQSRQQRLSPFSLFPDLLSSRSYELVSKRFHTKELPLEVRALPDPPVPGLKYVPVGNVQIASSIDRDLIKLGEGITLTVELFGDANLRPYELDTRMLDEQTDRFRFYVDEAETEVFPAEKLTMKKTFRVALIPKISGKLSLPVFSVVVFNPQSEEYTILKTPERTIAVVPSKDEAARIVAPETESTESSFSEQQSVQAIGEDLLPQHFGSAAVARRAGLPSVLFFLLLLGPPALTAIAAMYWQRWSALLSDPAKLRKLAAERNAIEALEREEPKSHQEAVTLAGKVLRQYLGDHFGVSGQSLTATEAYQLLSERTKDRELAEKLRRALSEVERLQYGGSSEPSNGQRNLQVLETTRSLIRDIELHGRSA